MAARRFGNPGPAHRLLHRPLHDRLVEVVPAALTGSGIDVGPRGREDPLPSPLPPGHRVLAGECAGEFHPSGTTPQVLPVLVADDFQMSCQMSVGIRESPPLTRSEGHHEAGRARLLLESRRFLRAAGDVAGAVRVRSRPGEFAAGDDQVLLANGTALEPAFQNLTYPGRVAGLGR